jgi:hypothetical protein
LGVHLGQAAAEISADHRRQLIKHLQALPAHIYGSAICSLTGLFQR